MVEVEPSAPNNGAGQAAAAPSPVSAVEAPPAPVSAPRRLPPPPKFDAKKSFQNADAAEKLKGYLRDVPVLHARLTKVIQDWEAQLALAKANLESFDRVTRDVEATVASWEKEKGEPNVGNSASTAPAAAEPPAQPGG